jgi:ribosome-associated toxin RatA of RatAB toxin-antitoxin module
VSGGTTIRATAEIPGVDLARVWDVVRDSAAYPRIVDHVLAVTGCGDGTAEWCVLLNGGRVTWIQREHADPPGSLAFEQTRGDFDALRGRWTLRSQGSGVEVSLRVEFHLGVDGLAALLDPIWAQSFQTHADALVDAVARESTRRTKEKT